jgi:hypothetical protein
VRFEGESHAANLPIYLMVSDITMETFELACL